MFGEGSSGVDEPGRVRPHPHVTSHQRHSIRSLLWRLGKLRHPLERTGPTQAGIGAEPAYRFRIARRYAVALGVHHADAQGCERDMGVGGVAVERHAPGIEQRRQAGPCAREGADVPAVRRRSPRKRSRALRPGAPC